MCGYPSQAYCIIDIESPLITVYGQWQGPPTLLVANASISQWVGCHVCRLPIECQETRFIERFDELAGWLSRVGPLSLVSVDVAIKLEGGLLIVVIIVEHIGGRGRLVCPADCSKSNML